VQKRPLCGKQVYASMEVAERMVIALAKSGITGVAERCSLCNLIHVREWEAR
jgi:hypothetical protein